MTIEAPPRPTTKTAPQEPRVDPLVTALEPEALIQEARDRAWRRRRRLTAIVVVLALVGVAVAFALAWAQSRESSTSAASVSVTGERSDPSGTIALTELVGSRARVYVWSPYGVRDTGIRGRAFGWSPDGSRLLVQRGSALYVVRVDSGNEVLLTRHGDGFNAAWSPDGTSVAYEAGGIPDHPQWHRILVVGADGRGNRVLPGWAVGGGFFSGNLTWTADGNAIVFAGRTDTDPRRWLYRVQVDGKTPPTPLPIKANARAPGQPTFSPDGERLAFTDSATGSIGDLIVIKTDGSHEWRFPGGTGPVWSPDGRMLAVRVHGATSGAWSIHADGTHRTRLPHGSWSGLSWSPDSQYIAYSGGEGHAPNGDLFAVRPDGTDVRRLLRRDGGIGLPLWRYGTTTTEAG